MRHANIASVKWVQFCIKLNIKPSKSSHCSWNRHTDLMRWWDLCPWHLNTLRPRPNGHHFADDVFKHIFLNENVCILLKISLKFVPKDLINNISALDQIMTWHWPGTKALSGPIIVRLPTHICVTWPQWVKPIFTFKLAPSTPQVHQLLWVKGTGVRPC